MYTKHLPPTLLGVDLWERAGRFVVLLLLGLGTSSAYGYEIPINHPDLRINWTNKVKLSTAYRLKDPDPAVLGGPGTSTPNPNFDDGNRNFEKGFISNRADLLSGIDLRYDDFGGRLSGAAWWDREYQRSTDNDSAATFNSTSVDVGDFPKDTEKLHGQFSEILDAFVSAKFRPAGMNLSLRVGQFTQIYGESLFFGANGIAAAQATVDVIKLTSVPGSEFQEILRPVKQVAANLQINSNWTIGAYHLLEFEEFRLPAVGSLFSLADFPVTGGERIIFPTGSLFRGSDIKGSDSGQFGGQIRYRKGNWELGAYGAKFHQRTPFFYFRPAPLVPNGDDRYVMVYPEDIKVYGLSAATVVGQTSVAGEVSVRLDTPMVPSGNFVITTPASDNDGNPAYPIGDSFHAQVSAIEIFEGGALWDGAILLAEVAFNNRLDVHTNREQLEPNTTKTAWAARASFTPSYFKVLPGVDLKVPLSLGFNPHGRSAVTALPFPPDKGGDWSIGLSADYQKTWFATFRYVNFFGNAGPVLDSDNNLSFDQTFKDKDFISLSLERTF